MSRLQIIIISIAVLLFAVLYFGVRKSPLSQQQVEQERAKAGDSDLINRIVAESKAVLSQNDLDFIQAVESEIDAAGSDSSKLEGFKRLSGVWFQLKNYAASGFYAEEVANINSADSTWSITGINYFQCFVNSRDNKKVNDFCFDKAVAAFEKAASLAPENLIHKENLAYCYTEHNDFSQVMKGVNLYQGILQQDSTNVKVLLRLGKLSVERTKDYPKALTRLEKAVQVAPNNFDANYYLAMTYQGLSRNAEAKVHYEKALALTTNQNVKDNIQQILNNF